MFISHKCYEFYDFNVLIWQFKSLFDLTKLHEIRKHFSLCSTTKKRHQKHLQTIRSDMDKVSPNICILHMFYKLAGFNNLLKLKFNKKILLTLL